MDQLESAIRKTLEHLGLEEDITISFVEPSDMSFGDISTSVALSYAKVLNISPLELAHKIVESTNDIPGVQKIDIAGPGFINIWFTNDHVREIIQTRNDVYRTAYTHAKVLVEHSSPNLFKPFHIGHLMNNIVGEFVVRAKRAGGAEVTTLSFPSDISLGIAKAIFIVQKDGGIHQNIFSQSEEKIISYLGEAYTRGVAHFEKHLSDEPKIKEIAQLLYGYTPSEAVEIYSKTKDINISYFLKTLETLGSHFDALIYESEAGVIGKQIVSDREGTIFTKSEGAIVYIPDSHRKDINTAVFINSQGNPTYEAKDIGLLALKFEKYNPDYSYTITDNEQISHFNVVFDAVSKFAPLWAERSIHIPHGRMTFKGKKMSSRLGGVPLANDVIDTVIEEVRERAGEKVAHLSDEEKRDLERTIALSALRVSILRSKPGSNINFDPESSLSFEGDSGPYLLYTHARTSSLLAKGKAIGYEPKWHTHDITALERVLAKWPRMRRVAIEETAPQKLLTYLFSVAQEFNSFYGESQIIVPNDISTEHRLMLVLAVKDILREGLYMIGIEAPNEM